MRAEEIEAPEAPPPMPPDVAEAADEAAIREYELFWRYRYL